jgi:hypothetical protein
MKPFLHRLLGRFLDHTFHRPPYYLYKRLDQVTSVLQTQQLSLALQYQEMVQDGRSLPSLNDVEFGVYSEAGEDGILWFLFSVLGTTNKTVVEMCVGDGINSNSANLIVNHGWLGYLFDGNPERIEAAARFYGSMPQTRGWPPVLRHGWIEPSGVNELLAAAGVPSTTDLLSLDMDGVDYWVLEALTTVEPRVLVVEFNNLWDPAEAVTIPNVPGFRAEYNSPFGADYSGASLGAFVKLCGRKGYRLVGAQRYGYNAFFVKNGLGEDIVPTVTPDACVRHPYSVHARTVRWHSIKERPWVRV